MASSLNNCGLRLRSLWWKWEPTTTIASLVGIRHFFFFFLSFYIRKSLKICGKSFRIHHFKASGNIHVGSLEITCQVAVYTKHVGPHLCNLLSIQTSKFEESWKSTKAKLTDGHLMDSSEWQKIKKFSVVESSGGRQLHSVIGHCSHREKTHSSSVWAEYKTVIWYLQWLFQAVGDLSVVSCGGKNSWKALTFRWQSSHHIIYTLLWNLWGKIRSVISWPVIRHVGNMHYLMVCFPTKASQKILNISKLEYRSFNPTNSVELFYSHGFDML